MGQRGSRIRSFISRCQALRFTFTVGQRLQAPELPPNPAPSRQTFTLLGCQPPLGLGQRLQGFELHLQIPRLTFHLYGGPEAPSSRAPFPGLRPSVSPLKAPGCSFQAPGGPEASSSSGPEAPGSRAPLPGVRPYVSVLLQAPELHFQIPGTPFHQVLSFAYHGADSSKFRSYMGLANLKFHFYFGRSKF